MILKTRKRDASSVMESDGWLYVDRITKALNHGTVVIDKVLQQVPSADSGHRAQPDGVRISCNASELCDWVNAVWGIERPFADEIWPDMSGEEQRCVTCVHLTRDDGTWVLALVDGDTFLLSEDGRNIDRLR